MRCRKGNCDRPALYAVCILLKGPGHLVACEATWAVSELNVCARHAAEIDGGDPFALEVLDRRMWDQIVAGFLRSGKRVPEREFSHLAIKPLDDPVVLGFRREM